MEIVNASTLFCCFWKKKSKPNKNLPTVTLLLIFMCFFSNVNQKGYKEFMGLNWKSSSICLEGEGEQPSVSVRAGEHLAASQHRGCNALTVFPA